MAKVRYKVTHCVRMSPSDAHYAGELVDGARLLGLFGDLATHLLILSDGEEGLFRAYESVEFLAPVYAGDFIEGQAEILQFGKSSRRMRFVARKVIEANRKEEVQAGRARKLTRPQIVCRAIGTCVVKGMQKK